ncbi:hypothetical protein V6N13_053931 [Hibiscus sabdariffa]
MLHESGKSSQYFTIVLHHGVNSPSFHYTRDNVTFFDICHVDNICLQARKDGYKAGCRSVLSIDGCHLKGYYGGTFLAVVAIDANDNIYPLAYVVVEAENQSSWKAISEVFPCAEHRTCVRHLYSNFKNRENFKGKNLKNAQWKATKATYVKEFEDVKAELKALSAPTFGWLKGNDLAQWSISHFSPRSKCDRLLSNLSDIVLCFSHRWATDNMPITSSSLAVCVTSSSSSDVSATTSSSQFVFIPDTSHVMIVRWMPSSKEDNTGNQYLSQSSIVIQTSQEDNHPCTMFLQSKKLLPELSVDHEVLNCAGNPHLHIGNALGSSIPSCQLLILVVFLLSFASVCSFDKMNQN